MIEKQDSDNAAAMTRLILDVFRFNGSLLDAGDELVSDIGLTSARWQVMGGIASSETPKPVAWIAQDMGLSRQAVQRVVNDLRKIDLVELRPNPRHARANYVVLTQEGMKRLNMASERQAEWVDQLSQGLDRADIDNASAIVRAATDRLLAKSSASKPKKQTTQE